MLFPLLAITVLAGERVRSRANNSYYLVRAPKIQVDSLLLPAEAGRCSCAGRPELRSLPT